MTPCTTTQNGSTLNIQTYAQMHKCQYITSTVTSRTSPVKTRPGLSDHQLSMNDEQFITLISAYLIIRVMVTISGFLCYLFSLSIITQMAMK